MINNNNGALDLASTIGLGVIQALTNTHTNLIGKVVKVNKKTIDVQPVVAREVDGETIPLPVFPDVPIINFLGGDSSIQMPIAIGDYCQLFVNERCLDSWYFGNDNKKPLSTRMFDYSDCVALVGLKNKNGELKIQNELLLTKNEVLRADGVRAGKWATNLSLGLFAASIVVSLYASSISKKLGIEEDRATDATVINIQGINNYYFCPELMKKNRKKEKDFQILGDSWKRPAEEPKKKMGSLLKAVP